MFVNRLEAAGYSLLGTGWKVAVHSKVRMGDVIDPDDADWTEAQRGFLRKAHFGFAVCDASLPEQPPILGDRA